MRLADKAPVPIGVGTGVGVGVGNPTRGVGVGVGIGLPWGNVPLIVGLNGLMTHPLMCSRNIAAKTNSSARVAGASAAATLRTFLVKMLV